MKLTNNQFNDIHTNSLFELKYKEKENKQVKTYKGNKAVKIRNKS